MRVKENLEHLDELVLATGADLEGLWGQYTCIARTEAPYTNQPVRQGGVKAVLERVYLMREPPVQSERRERAAGARDASSRSARRTRHRD